MNHALVSEREDALAEDWRDLYYAGLAHLGNVCARLSKPDSVHRVQIGRYLPPELNDCGDRNVVGWYITGALVALMARIVSSERSKCLLTTHPSDLLLQPPEPLAVFDSIILEQARTLGQGITTSRPVEMRVLRWERNSYPTFQLWLNALQSAAKILNGVKPPPINEPGLRQAKQQILAELGPVVERVRNKFATDHRHRHAATGADIARAFREEANKPEFPYLRDRVAEWIRFIQHSKESADLFYYRTTPPTIIFNKFLASLSGHREDYVRQCLARRPK